MREMVHKKGLMIVVVEILQTLAKKFACMCMLSIENRPVHFNLCSKEGEEFGKIRSPDFS